MLASLSPKHKPSVATPRNMRTFQKLPVVNMTCSCCGASCPGRQWHNRDTGYGLCVDCANRIEAKWATSEEPGEFQRCYGVRGTHFDIQEGSN